MAKNKKRPVRDESPALQVGMNQLAEMVRSYNELVTEFGRMKAVNDALKVVVKGGRFPDLELALGEAMGIVAGDPTP